MRRGYTLLLKGPQEFEDAIRPYIDKWEHLLPAWCSTLYIGYDNYRTDEEGGIVDDGARAENDANIPYRYAEITFFSAWLQQISLEREKTVLHEMCHLSVAPIYNEAARLVDDLPEELQKYALEKLMDALEGAVQDMRDALWISRPKEEEDD